MGNVFSLKNLEFIVDKIETVFQYNSKIEILEGNCKPIRPTLSHMDKDNIKRCFLESEKDSKESFYSIKIVEETLMGLLNGEKGVSSYYLKTCYDISSVMDKIKLGIESSDLPSAILNFYSNSQIVRLDSGHLALLLNANYWLKEYCFDYDIDVEDVLCFVVDDESLNNITIFVLRPSIIGLFALGACSCWGKSSVYRCLTISFSSKNLGELILEWIANLCFGIHSISHPYGCMIDSSYFLFHKDYLPETLYGVILKYRLYKLFSSPNNQDDFLSAYLLKYIIERDSLAKAKTIFKRIKECFTIDEINSGVRLSSISNIPYGEKANNNFREIERKINEFVKNNQIKNNDLCLLINSFCFWEYFNTILIKSEYRKASYGPAVWEFDRFFPLYLPKEFKHDTVSSLAQFVCDQLKLEDSAYLCNGLEQYNYDFIRDFENHRQEIAYRIKVGKPLYLTLKGNLSSKESEGMIRIPPGKMAHNFVITP